VIEMQEEAFATVEKAEAKEIVSEEGECREKENVIAKSKGRAARVSFVDDDLGTKGAIAIEALDVTFESGIGVVDDIRVEGFDVAAYGDGLVDRTIGEAGGWSEVGSVATEEAEVGIRIVAAVAHPAAKEEVASAEKVGVGGGMAGDECVNLGLKFGGEGLVGVEGENPRTRAALDGEVFLSGEALPWFEEELGLEGGSDFKGAVGGA
jgi:hypothetical protein